MFTTISGKSKNIHLSRKKAEILLKEIVERAKVANNMPITENMYYVTKLAVFGSFLTTDKEYLGDLDIAFECKGRWNPNTGEFYKLIDLIGKDKNFYSWYGRLNYPWKKVMLILKNRSRGISLHNFDDLQIGTPNEFPYKMIYEF